MRVQLLITCLCDLFYPEVGESTVRLLRRLGVEVEFPPDQTCCGQPAFNSGYGDEARAVAQHLIEAFSAGERDAVPVVTPSGSCAAMIRHHYPRLFAGDAYWAARAAAFCERVYELSEFIVHRLGRRALEGRFAATVAWHCSCHMSRELGLREEPLQLLAGLDGLELVELPNVEECCGFGGTFSVKMSAISTAMADAKLDAVRATGAEVLAGADLGCLMHLGGRLRRRGLEVRVMHLAEILERATRAAGGEQR
ncbi:MAG TPA: (Fe-S)-binding protein [Bacillota bacterium]